MNKIIKSVFSKILLYGLPLFYMLVAVSFYLGTYDSAQIKITITQIGGIFLICSWLVLKLETDCFAYLKKNFVITVPVLLFLISGIISYICSPFQLISLNEVIRRVIYCLFVLIIIDTLNNKKDINRLINFLIVTTYIVCIYAVIQFVDTRFFPAPPEKGLDPFVWRGAFGNRIFSTFGNPNFFGDFLAVMSPIVLALFFKKKSVHLLFLWLLVAFSLVFTYSKGAWLAFGAGAVAFAFIYLQFIYKAQRRTKVILFSIMILVVAMVVSGGIFFKLKQRSDSASFRIFTWMSCWEMINTHPVLGTGIGTFYVTYPSYRRPQIFFIEGMHNTESDHPENEYLEVWYDEGIIGFSIFILLLLMVLVTGFRSMSFFKKRGLQDGTIVYLQTGFLSALIAQMAHDCVCVSLRFVSSGVMFWLLIGLILSVSLKFAINGTKTDDDYSLTPLIKRPLQIIVILAGAYLISIFYGFFIADKLHSEAIQYSKSGNWDKAIETYEKVLDKNKSFLMARYFKANNYNDRWTNTDPQRAIDEYQNLWKLAPNYVQSKYMMGLVYSRLWEFCKQMVRQCTEKKDEEGRQTYIKNGNYAFNMALKYLNEYKMIDPIFPLTYYRLAWLYSQIGYNDQARNEYIQHLKYPENLQKPPHSLYVENWQERRTMDYAQTYFNLGNFEFFLGNIDASEQNFLKSLKLMPGNPEVLKSLTTVYNKKNDKTNYNKVVEILKKNFPSDPYVQQIDFKK